MENIGGKPRISVRGARDSDRKAVFKFCERTWSWGDYIPKVWDTWLKDKNGRVFVATIDEIPVGICHLSFDTPSEVWLRGARTDPKYRKMGVATEITKKCLEYTKEKGAKLARLVTESDNIAAQAVLRKLGFQPVAEFVEMVTEDVAQKKTKNSTWANISQTKEVWSYLQGSETYIKAAGLYTVLFHWFSLGKSELKHFIEQEKAILHISKSDGIDGLILIDDATAREWSKNTVQTCYVDGDFYAVLDMLKFLKNQCHALGVKKIYGFACNNKPIKNAFEKLGFKPPHSIDIVYEKKIL